MAFYGNITKPMNAFQFTKIYPNRAAMDFIFKEVELDQDKYEINKYYYIKDDIYVLASEDFNGELTYYEKHLNNDAVFIGNYVLVEYGTGNNYETNLKIDANIYEGIKDDGEIKDSFDGYDSTAWIKTSVTEDGNKTTFKYLQVAELNEVNPNKDGELVLEGKSIKIKPTESGMRWTDSEAINKNAIAFGNGTLANGDAAYAEGSNTIASQGLKFSEQEGLNEHFVSYGYNSTDKHWVLVLRETNDGFFENNKDKIYGFRINNIGDKNSGYDRNYINIVKLIKSIKNDNNNQWEFAIEPVVTEMNLSKPNGLVIHAILKDENIKTTSQHAEGADSLALGEATHAENKENIAFGDFSHAEGWGTIAGNVRAKDGKIRGNASHAEGYNTWAKENYTHAEGAHTVASGSVAHAEGQGTIASGNISHAEGANTQAIGAQSHAEGKGTKAEGLYSHAEGIDTHAQGFNSHAEGGGTIAAGQRQHVEGRWNDPLGDAYAHIVGNGSKENVKDEDGNVVEKYRSNAYTLDWNGNGWYAGRVDVSGKLTTDGQEVATIALVNTKPGKKTKENGEVFNGAQQAGNFAHAEGYITQATAEASHVEGYGSQAIGNVAHAEGHSCIAEGKYSHAEGRQTHTKGIDSHTEGYGTETTKDALHAHAEGEGTVANITNQHVQGKYNKYLNEEGEALDYAHVVGNGNAGTRSNAHTLDWKGNAWFAGSVTVGNGDGEGNALLTKDEIDDLINGSGYFTDEQKKQLESVVEKTKDVEEGAQVNVQSNWAEKSTESDAYILNKPIIPEPDWDEGNNNSPHYIKNKPKYEAKYDGGYAYLENKDEDKKVYLQTVNPNFVTYGVKIDLTLTDPLQMVTYTDDAKEINQIGWDVWKNKPIFKDIKPCLLKDNIVQGYLNPDNFTEFEDGTEADIISGSSGDVMIEIPKIGYRFIKEGEFYKNSSYSRLQVQITNEPNKKGFSYLAFSEKEEGDKDTLYVGAFLGSKDKNGKLRSLSEKLPIYDNSLKSNSLSFYQLTLLQCLYLIIYKRLDSTNVLGIGQQLEYVDDSYLIDHLTGETNRVGMNTEIFRGATYDTTQMKFLGIENFWGSRALELNGIKLQVEDFSPESDGIPDWSNGNVVYTSFDNFSSYSKAYLGYYDYYIDGVDGFLWANWQQISYIGYLDRPIGTNTSGFLPQSITGDSSKSFCDEIVTETSGTEVFYGASTNLNDFTDTGIFLLDLGQGDFGNISKEVGYRLSILL